MKQAVIFDLDETLFDHRVSAQRGVTRLLHELGAEASPGLVEGWERNAERLTDRRRAGEIDRLQYRRLRMRGLLADIGSFHGAWTVDDRACDQIYSRFVDLYEQEWAPFQDAVPVLQELRRRGLPVAVLTNGPEERQQRKVRHLGLRDLVVGVWTSEAMGASKPEPRSYLTVCEAMGVEAHQVLHVGDNEAFDLHGAKAAGLHGVHLDRTRQLAPSPQRISDLTGVLHVLGLV